MFEIGIATASSSLINKETMENIKARLFIDGEHGETYEVDGFINPKSIKTFWDDTVRTNFDIQGAVYSSIDNPELLYARSNKPIHKCCYCGQWAARLSECKHCGAAID